MSETRQEQVTMKAIEAILSRRSIRSFTEDDVSDKDVEVLLHAAMSAPSAHNAQPWHFIVIRDKGVLQKMKTIQPYAAMADQAPVAILVCGDRTDEEIEGYIAQDCAAATQNLLLAAHMKGLGAVWCGVYPRGHRILDFKEMFSLPDHIMPVSLVVLGHPAETKEPAERYDAGRVHKEQWQGEA